MKDAIFYFYYVFTIFLGLLYLNPELSPQIRFLIVLFFNFKTKHYLDCVLGNVVGEKGMGFKEKISKLLKNERRL